MSASVYPAAQIQTWIAHLMRISLDLVN